MLPRWFLRPVAHCEKGCPREEAEDEGVPLPEGFPAQEQAWNLP